MGWPALVNGYPIVFSDTKGLAEMALEPTMGWDKPWVYGPLILLFHWSRSLWGVVAAQTLIVSAVLWLVGQVAGRITAWRHIAIMAVLAAATAAPWFASFVMPDIFAPLCVLSLYLLAWGRPALSIPVRIAVALLAAIAIASHLAHLVLAAGCLAVVLLLRPRRLLACAAPLALALAWLLGSNLVGNGVLAISPYGSVFALARLQADGPAADYLHSVCPQAGYRLCAWSSQVPMDSDQFLWHPDGPIWGGESGPTLVAPEASRIVSATLRYEPVEALEAAARNTLRQLFMVSLGDTLTPLYLDSTVGLLLRTYFPPEELARFEHSDQVNDRLAAVAAPLAPVRLALLALGAAGAILVIPLYWRRRPALSGLAALTLVGLLANAASTGALSGPHDRYQARIAWLVVLPPLLALAGAGQKRL